jgi:DNA-directed RNA polymerase specialized sigma24 family protein
MAPKKASPAQPSAPVATPEEVQQAYEALTPTELIRLRNFADRRIRGLGRMALGRSAEGLLQEAITRVLQEKRHWKSDNVEFPQFLAGVIRSISSNWRAAFKRREASLGQGDAMVIREISLGVGSDQDPELQLPSRESLQGALEAKDLVGWLQELVKDHLYASAILDEMLRGLTGPETQEKLGITQNEYESTVKWIRNNARKAIARGIQNAG